MQKIMFNDRYGLTDAVLNGRKTMTRRIIPADIALWPDYAVSSDGEVCRKKDDIILNQYVQKSGYSAVYLKDRGWVSAVLVHRIVADAFLPRTDGLDMVDHINTIRSDNRVCNLRRVDAKGNANNELTKAKRRKK